MADILLFQTPDGGDINVMNGIVELDGGMQTAVYLSLFGGAADWWGNVGVTEAYRKYTAETGAIVSGQPWTVRTMLLIEDSAMRDLAWLTAGGYASTISVSVSSPELGTLLIEVEIDGTTHRFQEIAA